MQLVWMPSGMYTMCEVGNGELFLLTCDVITGNRFKTGFGCPETGYEKRGFNSLGCVAVGMD